MDTVGLHMLCLITVVILLLSTGVEATYSQWFQRRVQSKRRRMHYRSLCFVFIHTFLLLLILACYALATRPLRLALHCARLPVGAQQ